jgi:hypothetical protein
MNTKFDMRWVCEERFKELYYRHIVNVRYEIVEVSNSYDRALIFSFSSFITILFIFFFFNGPFSSFCVSVFYFLPPFFCLSFYWLCFPFLFTFVFLVYNPAHDAVGWIILSSYEFRNILFNKALVSVVITQITYRYIVRDTWFILRYIPFFIYLDQLFCL